MKEGPISLRLLTQPSKGCVAIFKIEFLYVNCFSDAKRLNVRELYEGLITCQAKRRFYIQLNGEQTNDEPII